MSRFRRLELCATAFFMAVAFVSLPFVARTEEPRSVTITIGSDTSMAGSTLVLPLAIDNPDNVEIQSLSVELSLPLELNLANARTSLAVETAGGTVQANHKSGDPDSNIQKIAISVSAPKPLPNGRLASLELRLAEQLPGLKEVLLTLEKGTITTADHKTAPALVQSGKITISETAPTLVNCFFFTH
jgi:hypothetical protein